MKTTNPAWLIVALREIESKIRDKAFVLTTIGTLVLIIATVAVSGFLGSRTSSFTVAAADDLSYQVLTEAQDQRDESTSLSIERLEPAQAQAELAKEAVDAVLESNPASDQLTLTGFDRVDNSLAALVSDAATTVLTDRILAAHDIDPGVLPTDDSVHLAQLHGDAERAAMIQVMALLFSFLFYMAALLFGMPIANSVIEEKQNRVVEILASTIRLRQLLAGKIIGNVILAMIQLMLFLGVGLLAAYLSPVEIPFLGVVAQVAGWFVVFFLGGFLVLAGLWAALGAVATRTEDLQQSTGPIVAVLIAVLFVGLYAKGTLLVVASYIPIASSAAMPIRMLSGEVALWEPLLSLAILLATCWVVLLLAERIYRRAVMHTGGTLTLRKALSLEV